MSLKRSSFCSRLLRALAVCAGLGVGSSDADAVDRVVRVGLHDAAPMAYRDAAGQPAGFGVEIIAFIARKEGWTLQFVDHNWSGCMRRLEAGEIDLLFPMSWTAERAKKFDFNNESLMQSWGRVFARPGSGIEGILDLEGKRIAVVEDDIFNADIRQLVSQFGIRCEFFEKATKNDVLVCIARGDVDAGAIEGKAGFSHAVQYDIEATSIVFAARKPLIAAPRGGGGDVLKTIDRHLAALKQDPASVYYSFYNRWFDVVNVSTQVVPRWLKWSLISGAALLVCTLVFTLILRSQVQSKTRELIHSEERLEYALGVTSDGLWDVNLQSGVMFVSRRWRETLGYGPDEIEPTVRAWEQLVHPDDMARVRKAMEDHFSGDAPVYECENRLRTKSGTYRWNLDRGKVVEWDPAGKPLRMIGVDADITRRKQAEEEREQLEEQLRHAQKIEAVGQLAGGIAHDFSNLLMVISAHTTLVRSRLPKTPELQESLQTIEDAVKHATGVTRSLLTFSRRLPAHMTPVDLCSVIQGTVRMLERTLPSAIELAVDTRCHPRPWVEADETQLQQVMLNLAINARDAMPAGGRLSISVESQEAEPHAPFIVPRLGEGMIRIVVCDTGQGMSADVRSRIFEPFFTTKSRHQRTGMGLAIIHGIIKEHSGRITVCSEEGRGALFAVDLPLTERRAERDAEIEPEVASGRGESVLLAEDNQQVREVLAAYLVQNGYKVSQFTNGAALLAELDDHDNPVDLVILNVDMPDIQQLECLAVLRRNGQRTPVVLMSGDVAAEVDAECEDVAMLVRPFHLDELGQLTRRFIEQKAGDGR